MKFSFSNIKTAFRNTKAIEKNPTENNIEDIINSINEDAFAVSEQNVLFANTKELGGYYYLITIVVGAFKIKTMKGATLNITSKDFKLELKSDMEEFESDHSNTSNTYITRIDFIIEKEDVSKINKSLIKNLTLSVKKQVIVFNTL